MEVAGTFIECASYYYTNDYYYS